MPDSPDTREIRSLQARIAAHKSWAATADRSERARPGNAALMARFEKDVDPHGILPPAQRALMAESAMKAHFSTLALRAKVNRRKAKAARAEAIRLEREAIEADAELAAEAESEGGAA